MAPDPPDRKDSRSKPRVPPLFAALAALQKGDGLLTMKTPQGVETTVTVVQGRVVQVIHERTAPAAIIQLLIHCGVLTEEELERAVRNASSRGTPATDAVRAAGLVREATLTGACEFLCHEVLMDLLLRMDLSVSEPVPPGRVVREMCAMPVRFLLREAQKRATELPEVRRVVPDDSMVFARTQTLSEAGGTRRWVDLPLGPAERQVFVFVDGQRDVTELARLTGQSAFKVARALKALMELDLVRPVNRRVRADSGPRRVRSIRNVVTASAIALIVAALLHAAFAGLSTEPAPFAAYEALRARAETERIEEAAKMYGLIHGRPPDTLEALRQDGLLREGGR